METKGKLTVLIGADNTTIEIEDESSGVVIARVKVSPMEFQRALSRIACVDCSIEATNEKNFNKIGKTMKIGTLSFPISVSSSYDKYRKEIARKEVCNHTPEGWEADMGFSSQDSFFEKDEVVYAKTFIRTWE